jgi:UDP-2,3-diacylglucosamine pyrophosphatase LpxH
MPKKLDSSVFAALEKKRKAPDVAKAMDTAADSAACKKATAEVQRRLRGKPQMWVVMSDIHYPEQDNASLAAVFDFVNRNRANIRGVVLLGDNLDAQSISRHTEVLPGLRKEGGFYEDLVGFDANVMTPIERMVPNATKVFITGNHEGWLTLFLEKEPQFKGALSWSRLLRMDERGWIFVPQGESFNIGPLLLIHGDQVGSGANVAKKLVDTHCASVIMGHVHAFGTHTKCSEVKKRDKWVGITLPCLTTLSPKYGKGRPNSHINGFGIVESFDNGRLFSVYVPIISEGKFCFAGKVYGR